MNPWDVATVAATAFSLGGAFVNSWANRHHHRMRWIEAVMWLWLIANVMWVVIDYALGFHGQIPLFVAYTATSVYGIYTTYRRRSDERQS